MTTIGDLTPNDIGNTDLIIRHNGSTITGTLMGMHLKTEIQDNPTLCSTDRNLTVTHVGVTLVLGSITIGPLERSHACEVIS